MKFSTRAEYGLKAIANLALAHPARKSTALISREEHISEKYLERLLGELKRNGLLISARGKEGGYRLSKSPSRLRVGDVIEVLEGTLSPMECASGNCINTPCRSKKVWITLEKQIRKTLNDIKLSDLI